MISVLITPHLIRMEGHASEYASQDGNLVCAAVSALTCTLINALQELSKDRITAQTESGRTIVEWQTLSDTGKHFVDAWFLGMMAIDENYHCIRFT